MEKAANRFASALLMPADAIRAEVGAHRSSISLGELVNLKIRFRVSVQALAYRCKDLGIINAATFSELFNTFAERGWRSPLQGAGQPRPGRGKAETFRTTVLSITQRKGHQRSARGRAPRHHGR